MDEDTQPPRAEAPESDGEPESDNDAQDSETPPACMRCANYKNNALMAYKSARKAQHSLVRLNEIESENGQLQEINIEQRRYIEDLLHKNKQLEREKTEASLFRRDTDRSYRDLLEKYNVMSKSLKEAQQGANDANHWKQKFEHSNTALAEVAHKRLALIAKYKQSVHLLQKEMHLKKTVQRKADEAIEHVKGMSKIVTSGMYLSRAVKALLAEIESMGLASKGVEKKITIVNGRIEHFEKLREAEKHPERANSEATELFSGSTVELDGMVDAVSESACDSAPREIEEPEPTEKRRVARTPKGRRARKSTNSVSSSAAENFTAEAIEIISSEQPHTAAPTDIESECESPQCNTSRNVADPVEPLQDNLPEAAVPEPSTSRIATRRSQRKKKSENVPEPPSSTADALPKLRGRKNATQPMEEKQSTSNVAGNSELKTTTIQEPIAEKLLSTPTKNPELPVNTAREVAIRKINASPARVTRKASSKAAPSLSRAIPLLPEMEPTTSRPKRTTRNSSKAKTVTTLRDVEQVTLEKSNEADSPVQEPNAELAQEDELDKAESMPDLADFDTVTVSEAKAVKKPHPISVEKKTSTEDNLVASSEKVVPDEVSLSEPGSGAPADNKIDSHSIPVTTEGPENEQAVTVPSEVPPMTTEEPAKARDDDAKRKPENPEVVNRIQSEAVNVEVKVEHSTVRSEDNIVADQNATNKNQSEDVDKCPKTLVEEGSTESKIRCEQMKDASQTKPVERTENVKNENSNISRQDVNPPERIAPKHQEPKKTTPKKKTFSSSFTLSALLDLPKKKVPENEKSASVPSDIEVTNVAASENGPIATVDKTKTVVQKDQTGTASTSQGTVIVAPAKDVMADLKSVEAHKSLPPVIDLQKFIDPAEEALTSLTSIPVDNKVEIVPSTDIVPEMAIDLSMNQKKRQDESHFSNEANHQESSIPDMPPSVNTTPRMADAEKGPANVTQRTIVQPLKNRIKAQNRASNGAVKDIRPLLNASVGNITHTGNASVLDGHLNKTSTAPKPVSTAAAKPKGLEVRTFTPKPKNSTYNDVLSLLGGPDDEREAGPDGNVVVDHSNELPKLAPPAKKPRRAASTRHAEPKPAAVDPTSVFVDSLATEEILSLMTKLCSSGPVSPLPTPHPVKSETRRVTRASASRSAVRKQQSEAAPINSEASNTRELDPLSSDLITKKPRKQRVVNEPKRGQKRKAEPESVEKEVPLAIEEKVQTDKQHERKLTTAPSGPIIIPPQKRPRGRPRKQIVPVESVSISKPPVHVHEHSAVLDVLQETIDDSAGGADCGKLQAKMQLLRGSVAPAEAPTLAEGIVKIVLRMEVGDLKGMLLKATAEYAENGSSVVLGTPETALFEFINQLMSFEGMGRMCELVFENLLYECRKIRHPTGVQFSKFVRCLSFSYVLATSINKACTENLRDRLCAFFKDLVLVWSPDITVPVFCYALTIVPDIIKGTFLNEAMPFENSLFNLHLATRADLRALVTDLTAVYLGPEAKDLLVNRSLDANLELHNQMLTEAIHNAVEAEWSGEKCLLSHSANAAFKKCCALFMPFLTFAQGINRSEVINHMLIQCDTMFSELSQDIGNEDLQRKVYRLLLLSAKLIAIYGSSTTNELPAFTSTVLKPYTRKMCAHLEMFTSSAPNMKLAIEQWFKSIQPLTRSKFVLQNVG